VISTDRLAGAPITWGVCEVPGWGVMLPADRVLSEMRSLGITATELGAPGFLPRDADAVREVLERHGMTLVGGFVPVVLHDRDQRDATMAEVRATADLFVAAGATMFVSAVVVDQGWGPRIELSRRQWDHLIGMLDEVSAVCSRRGLTHVLHPHVGTLIQTRDEVYKVLERSKVLWCLDTGHLLIGGCEPERFAVDACNRIGHVHLKDVDDDLAARVNAGELTIQQAVKQGLFRPLGTGDAPIYETIERLEACGYEGWYVLEQDADLGSTEPAPGTGPIDSARASVHYLRSLSKAAGVSPPST
jgi:inosose dehydratase